MRYSTSGKVITGYVLERVEGEAKGKIGKDGSTVTYVYKPIGSWIPNIPGQPTNPIKYPNDPQDPTKPGQPTEVLPYVPGFTPEDKDGNPLKTSWIQQIQQKDTSVQISQQIQVMIHH